MNEVHLIGTLAFDPRIKFFDSGKSKATALVAAQAPGRQYPDKVDVAAWDEQGQQLGDMKQGDLIEIFGRITTESWDDRTTGKKVYKTVVIAESVATPAVTVQQGQPQRQAPARRQTTETELPF